MARQKDDDGLSPKAGRRRRSAVPDITEKLPRLPELAEAGSEEAREVTRTDPVVPPADRRPARLREDRPAPPASPALPAPRPTAPPHAPERRPTPAARRAPPVKLGDLPEAIRPKTPPAALSDDEDEAPATIVSDLLSAHYAGPKAGLKPVFDALLEAARRLGQVKVIAGPVYVTISRNRDFAILMTTPQGDRVELGLVLPGRPPTRRLNRARHFDWGERFTHYVTLRYRTDVDSDVRSWLTEACWAGG